MPKAIITVGLQFGDEAKGATVDYLCRTMPVDLVVRYSGGCQCAHTVVLPDGRSHTFSQFGAGTLAGVPTYLGPEVIVDPPALLREASHLEELGVEEPCRTLTIHPDCLLATPYHRALNQAREVVRGDRGRHGSCGRGVGEARSYWLRYGQDAPVVDDARNPRRLRAKLELLRQRYLAELAGLDDQPAATADLLRRLPPAEGARTCWEVLGRFPIRPYITGFEGLRTLVCEGAQGVLLDEWHGFHPHTTWSTVTPRPALELLREHDDSIKPYVLGVARAFTTRHGAGPLPSFDPALDRRLRDEHNPPNDWQGSLRFGHLDLPLLRYAAEVCDLEGCPLDGIALSWLDRVDDRAGIVTGHHWCGLDLDDQLVAGPVPGLERQERVGGLLQHARPVTVPATPEGLRDAVGRVAPVVIEGRGPTWRDRTGGIPA